MNLASTTHDLQLDAPDVPAALSGVGVRGLRCMVPAGGGTTSLARIDATVDLAADRRGAHMSRFHEVVADAVGASLTDAPAPDLFAARIAHEVAQRQGATRASVCVAVELQLEDRSPVTRRPSPWTVLARGHATVDLALSRARRALSATVVGMTACPCAQELTRERARERLLGAGFDDAQAQLALELVPVATHNQRGTATLVVGTESVLDVATLAGMARGAMSSPIHELLKREDEVRVVEDAHAAPRFVEDCVRGMLAAAVATDPLGLGDEDFVWAHQRNHESIHAHDVVAERGGHVADLRAEIEGGAAAGASQPGPEQTTHGWLAGTFA